jgi:hypothetical protein
MLFKEIISVYSENHTKPIDTLCGQNSELLITVSNSEFCSQSVHVPPALTIIKAGGTCTYQLGFKWLT